MKIEKYFKNPQNIVQRQYEALRAHFLEKIPLSEAAIKYSISESYLRKMRSEVQNDLNSHHDPFFIEKTPGPKSAHKADKIEDLVVSLRKENLSIIDIKSMLESKGMKASLDTINRILNENGFTRLPRRTYEEKRQTTIAQKFESERTCKHNLINEAISTGKSGGILAFLPLIEELGIIKAIEKAGFPETSDVTAVSYILSFLALKLMGNKRVSYDESWCLDRVLGLFAGLNVLPKSSSLTSYSYRVSRANNRALLLELSRIFDNPAEDSFNLDFKTIPHWGDDSVLEKHYASDRGKSVKSVLALIVQSVDQQNIAYTDAEIVKSKQQDAILEFVDFWKEGHGVKPKMLIFDSKVTIRENLNKLNKDGIKFVTLRQRGPKMLEHANSIPDNKWEYIWVEAAKKKTRDIKLYDEKISMREYEGLVRQIIIVDHSKEPVFIITNDFETSGKDIVRKYGRRWLVEKEISEQIVFFHLNQLSSSIVVKVDFDLTLTVLAHNLYRKLANQLIGFANCNVDTLYRRFIDGRADVEIMDKKITVKLGKRSHLPILFEASWMDKKTNLSWHRSSIEFKIGTSS